jgi:hypothetical protein
MLQPLSRGASVLAAIAVGLTACGAASAAKPASTPSGPPASRPPACVAAGPNRIAPNSWSQARSQLAPTGASAIRLCRYAGLNGHPPRSLVRAALVTSRTTVASLVQAFDRLPAGTGTFSCPVDDGSAVVALLSYPHGRVLTISVGLRGCQVVTNGDLRRTASGTNGQPGPALVSRLERLTS